MLMIFNVPKEVVGNLNINDGATDISEETLIEVVKYIDNGVIVQDGATNGDVIKALFPNKQFVSICSGRIYDFTTNNKIDCDLEWWNAPYKEKK